MTAWDDIDKVLGEMIESQQKALLKCGQRIVPFLTMDDILQPNDFSELENHPFFRYEEGVLAGFLSIQMALKRLRVEIDELAINQKQSIKR
jgi:hypothetical protein